MKKENLSLIIIGAVALLIGFGGWYLYSSFFGSEKQKQSVPSTTVNDQVPSESPENIHVISTPTEEEVEEKSMSNKLRLGLAFEGEITNVSDNSIVVKNNEDQMVKTVLIDEQMTEIIVFEMSEEDGPPNSSEGTISDFESGQSVKVTSEETIGEKEEFTAANIILRK